MKSIFIVVKKDIVGIYSGTRQNIIDTLYDIHGFGFEDDVHENARMQDVNIAIANRDDIEVQVLDATGVDTTDLLFLCHRFETEMRITG